MNAEVPTPAKLTCKLCGRKGTRSFNVDIATGTATCTAIWACSGRQAEQQHREAKPEETTCHKCGRIGWRGFVRDREVTGQTAYRCSARAACSDRQRVAAEVRTAKLDGGENHG